MNENKDLKEKLDQYKRRLGDLNLEVYHSSDE